MHSKIHWRSISQLSANLCMHPVIAMMVVKACVLLLKSERLSFTKNELLVLPQPLITTKTHEEHHESGRLQSLGSTRNTTN